MATPTDQESEKALREISEMVNHHLELADRMDQVENALRDIAKGLVLVNQQVAALADNTKVQISRAVCEVVEILKYEIHNLAPLTQAQPQWLPGNNLPSMGIGKSYDRFRGIELTAQNAKELLQNAKSQDEVESILKAIRPH